MTTPIEERMRERAEKIIGRELDDFLGKNLQEMLKDSIKQALLETRNEALNGPEVRELVEALDRIRTIDSPVFNGERVTTINPTQLSRWQVIAEEALSKFKQTVGK